jgi:hypothetical protein
MSKYARKSDTSGLGINEGFVFSDGEFYTEDENEALKKAKESGYNNLEEAYNDEAYYWTEWETDYFDEGYYTKNGKYIEI